MKKEDIRLTPMDFDALNETLEEPEGIRFKDTEAIANTATDKAIKKIVEFVIEQPRITDKDWGYGLFMCEVDIEALKKLVEP